MTTPAKVPLDWPNQPTDAQQAESPLRGYRIPRAPGRWPQSDFEWLALLASLPADPIPIPVLGGIAESGQVVLFGGSINNASTNAGVVTLYDGTDNKGQVIAVYAVPANGQAQVALPNVGVYCQIGLFVGVSGGAYTGSLFVGHPWKYDFSPTIV